MPEQPTPEFQALPEDEVYREIYANNVFFEPSGWDMKLIFGQLDQRTGKIAVRQHTAVTLPWAQIKLMLYWLQGHLELHEKFNGKVRIPFNAIPGEIQPPSEELRKHDPNVDAAFGIFQKFREKLVEEQKA